MLGMRDFLHIRAKLVAGAVILIVWLLYHWLRDCFESGER